MVLITITAAGVVYAWVRDLGDSVWPVTVLHNAFNTFMETAGGLSVAGTAATLAYVTTETGVFTLLTVVGIAAVLMARTWPSTPDAQAEAPIEPVQASAAIS
jgi:membrane protease YdiL (CAAX protease family)